MKNDLAALREKPDISTNYQSNRDRIPLKERYILNEFGDNFDEKLQKKRNFEKKRRNLDDENCPFAPKINRNSDEIARSVDDLIQWGDKKRFKLAARRLSKLNKNMHSFKPEISSNSKRLTKKRKGKVHDRLMKSAQKSRKKLEELRKSIDKELFKPTISKKSKLLAKGLKDESLYKTENGKSKNLDFFEAKIKGTGTLDLYSSKKNNGRSRSALKKKKENISKIEKIDLM